MTEASKNKEVGEAIKEILDWLGAPKPITKGVQKAIGLVPETNRARVSKLCMELDEELRQLQKDHGTIRQLADAVRAELIPFAASETVTQDAIFEHEIREATRHDEAMKILAEIAHELRKRDEGSDVSATHITRTARYQAEAYGEGPGGSSLKEIPHFTGRSVEMDALQQFAQSSTSKIPCIVVSGIGGVGKSALAKQFSATIAKAIFTDGTFWLRGDLLATDLERLAQSLKWDPALKISQKSHVEQILEKKRCLLIIDGFSSEHVDMSILPIPSGYTKTLITTTERDLHQKVGVPAEILQLGMWSLGSSRTYLKKFSVHCREEADDDLDRLSQFVGCLPLGVRLLAGLMDLYPDATARTLLEMLTLQGTWALDELDLAAKGSVERGIEKTFAVVWKSLLDPEKLTLTALAVCAKNTSTSVVKAVSGLGDRDLRRALAKLRSISMVDYESEEICPWATHDVVRLFTLFQFEKEDTGHKATLEKRHLIWAATHIYTPRDPKDHRGFLEGLHDCILSAQRVLTTAGPSAAHLLLVEIWSTLREAGSYFTALKIAEDFLPSIPEGSLLRATWLNILGMSQDDLFQYEQALASHAHAITILEALESDDLELLSTYFMNTAVVLGNLGRYKEAVALHKKVIAMKEGLPMPNRAVLATAYDNISNALDDWGQVEQALQYSLDALDMRIQIYGEDHQLIGQSYGNLGAKYYFLKDYDKMLQCYERALEIQLKVLGEEHPFTISSYNNIGLAWSEKNDHSKAFHYYSLALAARRRLHGENHPETAQCYNNIAFIHSAKGEYDEALALLQRCYDVEVRVLGQAHPRVAKTVENMAEVHRQVGHYQIALELYQNAIEMRENSLIPNHPYIVSAYNIVGGIHCRANELRLAETAYQRALDIQAQYETLPDENTVVSLINIGNVRVRMGQAVQGMSDIQKGLVISATLKVVEPSFVIQGNMYLARAYASQHQFDEALEYSGGALSRSLESDEDVESIAAAYMVHAEVHVHRGDYEAALSACETGLALKESVLTSRPDLFSFYNLIGLINYKLGRYDAAIERYKSAWTISEDCDIDNYGSLVLSNNIGMAYLLGGDAKEALEWLSLALKRHVELCADGDPSFRSRLCNNLGLAHLANGEDEEALDLHETALMISVATFGDEHPETASSLKNIGLVHQHRGDRLKAISYLTRAFEILLRKLGEDHPDTNDIRVKLTGLA